MNLTKAISLAAADHREQNDTVRISDAKAVAEMRDQLDVAEVDSWDSLVKDGIMEEETRLAYRAVVSADEIALKEALAESGR